MNRIDACVALAQRIGGRIERSELTDACKAFLHDKQFGDLSFNADHRTDAQLLAYHFCFFTDLDTAIELVKWMSANETYAAQFLAVLREILFEDSGKEQVNQCEYLLMYMLATAEQITRAACATFGIKLDKG